MTSPSPSPDAPSRVLVELAGAHGIATEYHSFFGEHVRVPATTLTAILAALGVEVEGDADAEAALHRRLEAPWRDLVPATTVVIAGGGAIDLHVADGADVEANVGLEDGSWRHVPIDAPHPESRVVDGRTVWRVRVALPGDLPLGWHTLHVTERRRVADGGADGSDAAERYATGALIVTPARLDPPVGRTGGRSWGLMAQLYSVRSRRSWGLGDYADLADLAAVAGDAGADYLLINPVHAAEITSPIEPSPYLPSSRRFLAPLYVRPEIIPEAAYLDQVDRAHLEALRSRSAAADTDPRRLDRDAVWTAKRAALERIFAVPRGAGRQAEFDAYVAREGAALADFALWCAVREHEHDTGRPLPVDARIDGAEATRLRSALADRIAFHSWLQWIVDEQLAAAGAAAAASGMRIGVMHDLAVGVHTRGSDAWSLHDLYAPGITVGAPPDMYNQQGQNWNQPPWSPDALVAHAYAPLRDMIRSLLRHAGALRIDHILGFFRLWWIPSGLGAGEGTYVRYDHEAMIGVLALEAQRAGAVVIGEDLGLVEPWVRDYLAERGVLGTSVLWFERDDDGGPLDAERYRPGVLATVNTHDLPPTAGYLAGEHVALRARLDLLTRPLADEVADFEAERDRMLAALRSRGLIGADPTEQQVVEALHVFLAASPSLLLGVSLVDAVGETRIQNQPGTDREYPNWQVPLAGPDGQVVLLDDLAELPRFRSLVATVDDALRSSVGG